MSRAGSRRAVAVVAAALCGGAAAFAVAPEGWPSPDRPAVTSTRPAPAPPELTLAPPQPSASTPPVAEPTGPDRVVVERLGVDLPVVPQGVDPQGRMALPDDPGVAGWYRFGPAPASPAGAVVVAAHVDSRERGIGPFARLSAAGVGDPVLLQAQGRQWRYVVTEVVEVAKDTADLARFFARDGAPRLHLVTCTGRYQPGSGYTANLVVVAERAEPAP